MKILHLIPHMGGGAGKVLSMLVDALQQYPDIEQAIACFEHTNLRVMTWDEQKSIRLHECCPVAGEMMDELIAASDIIHLHFWNHPATYHFIFNYIALKKPTVVWSYVNGRHDPQAITDAVLDFSHIFVSSTNYSANVPALMRRDTAWRDAHLRTIFMTAGIAGFDSIEYKGREKFTIGYIGTVDPCKLYGNFVDLCSRIDLPELDYLVYGGPKHLHLAEEVKKRDLEHRVKILGPIDNVPAALSGLDVFAYPLCSENYGTGEQALIEAMAAGIPQVVFAGGPEAHVVQNGVTGFTVNSEEGFADAVRHLHNHPHTRTILGRNSKKYAQKMYSIHPCALQWYEIYKELLLAWKKKSLHRPPKSEDISPEEIFLASLEDNYIKKLYNEAMNSSPGIEKLLRKKILRLHPIFSNATRGSLSHYAKYFFKNEPLANAAKQLYPRNFSTKGISNA